MTAHMLAVKCNGTNVRFCRVRQRIVRTCFNVLWACTPRFAKLITKRVFFTPSTYKVTPAEKQYLDNAKRFEISVHDKTVTCWKWGNGPGIVLAHGWNGRGIQLHHFIEPLIRRGYSAIAYDAPGHGESQGKTSSYFEFTDTIRTLLASSNGHDIRGVIAHSLGAAATVNSIEKRSQPLEAVLIAPALKLAEVLYKFFDAIGLPEAIYQSLIKEYEDQFGYSMRRDNPSNLLKAMGSRTLIVHDKNDPTIPYTDSQQLSNEFQNIELHTTEGLGHKRILTDGSVVDLVVNHFGKSAR
ncbi:MAG: alpha/beta hydrolase [Deltaproteobacteria bacterium]|nr:MAG: alpha/beta hydrolase [Deltaproteobacteria bacterium]